MATTRSASRTHPATPERGPQSVSERIRAYRDDPVLQRIRPKGMIWACEDEESKVGESTLHTLSVSALLFGLTFHFARLPGFRVFSNLNLYFSTEHPNLFLAPDIMVVQPPRPLPLQVASYRIGEQGPPPLLVAEVLSPRTFRQGDLTDKPVQYGEIGVDEYLLADVTGEMLSQRLLLLRRQQDENWQDEQDADGGITSRLGFRVVIEGDGHLRLIDAKTGERYARPEEAQAEAEARRRAEERVRALEEELARLRGTEAKGKKGKGRRRKS